MGVRDNHTKYEPETQQCRPGTGVASAGPPFQSLQFGAKISLFSLKNALEPAKNGQMKRNSGHSTHAASKEGRKEAASTREMGKNHSSFVFRQSFGGCYLWV